jgi:hypothetical protein
MGTASFTKTMNADSLDVHGHLLMNDHASFAGDVTLVNAQVGGNLLMDTASFTKLDADSLNVRAHLLMNDHASFAGDVNLVAAKIGGSLDMGTASFTKLDANLLDVRAHLLMNDHASFAGDVSLVAAKIGGSLDMGTASFTKTMNADSLDVHDHLAMNDHASFVGDVTLANARVGGNLRMDTSSLRGDVILIGAKIGGDLDMGTTAFSQLLNAESLDVSGRLRMDGHAAFAGHVILRAARVRGDIEMVTASFTAVDADRLDVRGSLFMREANFIGNVDLAAAKIGRLDLQSATFVGIDLSEAVIGSDLLLGGVGWRCNGGPVIGGIETFDNSGGVSRWSLGDHAWRNVQCGGTARLVLRNTHIATFQDSADAWPLMMDLEGFHYDRLGGIGGTAQDDMRHRSIEEWVDWLARDRVFSPQPYAQLAAVLTAAGRREAAEAILFAGHEREREELLVHREHGIWSWLWHGFPNWLWLTFFSGVAGYGIGLFTFRVLWWVVGLTILGAIVLGWSPHARRRGVLWRLGASLHRLLPDRGAK